MPQRQTFEVYQMLEELPLAEKLARTDPKEFEYLEAF